MEQMLELLAETAVALTIMWVFLLAVLFSWKGIEEWKRRRR